MAKKKQRRSTKSRKQAPQAPQHVLPDGFWAQVGAVLLIVFSLLIILSWFNLGGPVLEWLNEATMNTIGYAVYVVPILFIYVAVEIFRAEDNRLPFVMKFATALSLVWFAGLFGLLKDNNGRTTGGFVGDLVNSGMIALVEPGVAAFVYILLIFLTALFILRVSPFTVIKKIWELTRRDTSEQEENVKVMRSAAAVDAPKKSLGDFTLNAGVPMAEVEDDKKPARRSSLKGSTPPDKAAEEKTALITINDPNWQAPSIDLLEKKESPANAGDVQQNAQTIKDTLSEFNIDVETIDFSKDLFGKKITHSLTNKISIDVCP